MPSRRLDSAMTDDTQNPMNAKVQPDHNEVTAAIERTVRREAGLPEDPNWYAKLTYAHLPRPNTPCPCPRWIDPKWWGRMWPRKPAGMRDEKWCQRLCDLFNSIDRRGRYG
jgi:hypothetical protein